MAEDFNPPQQDRSRQTLDRLIRATLKVLNEHGLEEATIPRIAACAEVAPASIYRRFKDKDALLRAAFTSLLERSAASSANHFSASTFRGKSLEESVRNVVGLIGAQYLGAPRLLQAFSRFTDLSGNEEFSKWAHGMVADNLRRVALALTQCDDGPSCEKGLLGIMTIASALEIRALAPSSLWSILSDRTDAEIEGELAEMLLAFLRAQG